MSRLLPGSRGRYMPLDDLEDLADDDSPNQIGDWPDESPRDNADSLGFLRFYGQIRLPRINFSRLNTLQCRLSNTHKVIFCVIHLLVVPTVCILLGVYTTFLHKPAPVIDKSYNAFEIPNHQASLNFGAFRMAGKNHTSFLYADFSGYGAGSRAPGRHSNIEGGRPGGKYDGKGYAPTGEESHREKRAPSSSSSLKSDMSEHRYNSALARYKTRLKRSNSGNMLIQVPLQYYPLWKMQVVFMTKDGENIFTPKRLQAIHEIEKAIMKEESYSDFCYKDMNNTMLLEDPAVKVYNGCAPLNSLLTYFFPSTDSNGSVFLDGLGDNIDNIESALGLAMQSNHFYYYVDEKVNSTNRNSRLLRTEVLFGAPVKGFRSPYHDRHKQTEIYKRFVIRYIDLLSKVSNSDIKVLYGGNEIFDYEVEMTFWNDIKLAAYSLVAIFLLMLVLTYGSVWLTVTGLVSILLSVPLAIFFYTIVFGIQGLGILNGAAAFVIIGIGVDDVFVFINVFRQADHLTSVSERTMYTTKTAGKATFFTSFTTAAAFAANIASMIPAVHDFGLFMSLIVGSCWVTVMLVMPPALFIWALSCNTCESYLMQWFVCGCRSKRLTLPEDVAQFMNSSHDDRDSITISREIRDDQDADVPMLSMDLSTQYGNSDDDDDEPLILADPDPLYIPEDTGAGGGARKDPVGSCLQAAIYYYLALPIMKARWVIIGVSTAILITSAALTTQLHTSTQPPQFFKSDTNIQQLLNLKAKFSAIDTVKCYECSGIYNIGKVSASGTQPQTRPPVVPPPATHPPPPHPPSTAQPAATAAPATESASTTAKPTEKTPVQPPTEATTPVTSPRPQPTTEKPVVMTTAKPPSFTLFPPWTPRTLAPQSGSPSGAGSVPSGFDACKGRDCSHPQERPLLESGATVYVVFGVKDFKLKQKDIGHVVQDSEGILEYDSSFSEAFNFSNPAMQKALGQLCRLCKLIANNTELVRNGSAQCLPSVSIPTWVQHMLLGPVPECHNLPSVSYIYGRQEPAHAVGSLTRDRKAILWLGFAFESTTSKGKSYFEAYKEYQKWEEFLAHLKATELEADSPLQDAFQTSEFWPEVLMEIVAVNSAIYGVALSMIICMVSVVIFTRHVLLLLVILISIVEMVCCVVGIFYLVGWEIGGVEAISLSILVGSSVDYCVHLVEGYLLAASACPIKDDAKKARQWRTSAAFSHIGSSIISSALTTIIAVIPLTQTVIQPFAKFGQIIAINTTVCIVYSLTVCTALLSTIAPAYFKPTWKSLIKAIVGTCVVLGSLVLALYIMFRAGVDIQGPNGSPLFPK